MKVNIFPSDAVDFFMRSLAKIKQDREKEAHKVSGNLRAIVAESTLKWDIIRKMISKVKSKYDDSTKPWAYSSVNISF